MTGTTEEAVDSQRPGAQDVVRIRCQADRRIYGIDVEWMKGAIFEFDTREEAETWVEDQNLDVPGTLFLEEAPERDDGLAVDLHLKYSRPD